jgi:hypothetical protein
MKFKYVKKFEGGGSIKDFIKSDAYNSSFASVLKMIDPTGISSYGDVYNAWTDGKTDYNDFLEPLGALPLIGKAGKALKLIPKLEKLGSVGKFIKNLSEYSDAQKILNKTIPNPKALSVGNKVLPRYPGQPRYINPNSAEVIKNAKDIVNQNKMITYPLLGVRGVDFANGATETY